VTVRPETETKILLDDVTAAIAAVERVLDALGVEATVIGETELPIGSGFGVSGAMALGTALGANAVFDLELSVAELTTVAHGAEVQAGTGLGDVVAQARGGMVLRLEAGAPRANELDGIPARPRVEYLTLGELDTSDVIGGDTDRLSAAGDDALSRVVEQPTVEQFMYASRRFAREAGLLTPDVKDVIVDVTESGGEASMAMLGETVFALGRSLSEAGYDPNVCRVDPTGATILAGDDANEVELRARTGNDE
jgi:pantoate kinase